MLTNVTTEVFFISLTKFFTVATATFFTVMAMVTNVTFDILSLFYQSLRMFLLFPLVPWLVRLPVFVVFIPHIKQPEVFCSADVSYLVKLVRMLSV